jgi:hypothetical protein
MKLDLPQPRDWQVFEDLCRDLWAERWGNPNTRKHGRTGQKQRGVDIFGQPADGAWEVCCKRYERQPTRAEIEHELEACDACRKTVAPAGPRATRWRCRRCGSARSCNSWPSQSADGCAFP